MAQKYVQLMEDLQYSRRQMQNWRQKQIITEQQLQNTVQQNHQLKKMVQRMQQTNSKLVETNRQLSEQKQSIMTDYSTEVSFIKQQIVKKQREILQLKQITSPTAINHELAIRQLKFELTDQFSRQIASKERRIQELTALVQKQAYEKQIEKEKAKIKLQSLQAQIKEMQMKHQAQIIQYSNKLFQQTQNRPPQERQLLRRTKKQNQELRRRFDLATADLSTVLQQKNQVHKDYSKWMKQHQKLISQHQTQIFTYKAEIARLTELADRNSSKRDQIILKDKDRDIKKLKTEAQQLRDQMLTKQKKISELQVDRAKLQAEIKSIRSEQDRAVSKVEETTQWERDRLQKELIQARASLERMRVQNIELNERVYEATRTTTSHKMKFQDFKREEEEQRNRLKRQLSEQTLAAGLTIQNKGHIEPTNQNQQQTKHLQEALRGEQGKLRDFLAKYIELKKKYQLIQKKLKKANQKIVQLLQTKIALGSPKATTTKHFQFPTQPRTQERFSPSKPNQKLPQSNTNIQRQNQNQPQMQNAVNNSNQQNFMTTADFRPYRPDAHSKTNPSFNRQFLSPQDNRHIRIQDEERQSNEQSFYEKSLKMRNKRFKELKCTNHEQHEPHETHEHHRHHELSIKQQ